MPKGIQDKTLEHYVYVKNMENTTNGCQEQRTIGNRKGTRLNKPRRPFRIYLALYISVQQKEIQKVTRTERMGL